MQESTQTAPPSLIISLPNKHHMRTATITSIITTTTTSTPYIPPTKEDSTPSSRSLSTLDHDSAIALGTLLILILVSFCWMLRAHVCHRRDKCRDIEMQQRPKKGKKQRRREDGSLAGSIVKEREFRVDEEYVKPERGDGSGRGVVVGEDWTRGWAKGAREKTSVDDDWVDYEHDDDHDEHRGNPEMETRFGNQTSVVSILPRYSRHCEARTSKSSSKSGSSAGRRLSSMLKFGSGSASTTTSASSTRRSSSATYTHRPTSPTNVLSFPLHRTPSQEEKWWKTPARHDSTFSTDKDLDPRRPSATPFDHDFYLPPLPPSPTLAALTARAHRERTTLCAAGIPENGRRVPPPLCIPTSPCLPSSFSSFPSPVSPSAVSPCSARRSRITPAFTNVSWQDRDARFHHQVQTHGRGGREQGEESVGTDPSSQQMHGRRGRCQQHDSSNLDPDMTTAEWEAVEDLCRETECRDWAKGRGDGAQDT